MGIALITFVQASNVFPQLLLARLFFSMGSAATSTMITAILPSMTVQHEDENRHCARSANIMANDNDGESGGIVHDCRQPQTIMKQAPTRLAGIVGLFTGCGALLALTLFLRLPDLLQRAGVIAEKALINSYYIVGAVSLVVSLFCYAGLRRLKGEEGKGWRALIYGTAGEGKSMSPTGLSSLRSLFRSVAMGYQNSQLGLG